MSSAGDIYLPSDPLPPAQVINTDQAVSQWTTSNGFRVFWAWVQRRCERIRGRDIIAATAEGAAPAIKHLMLILDSLINWVDLVPPEPQQNQRFGNMAFRSYYRLIEQRLPPLLTSVDLPPHLATQILPLLLQSNSFGHPTRLDYGTGHELAFMLALWCCAVSGWVGSGENGEDEQDELILRVFARYLELTTLMQMTYRLEPAGSHGVWGLDDYCFLPYLFGSAQLLDSDLTPPRSLQLALSLRPPASPSTSTLSTVPTPPTQPITDFFTLSLYRLTLFKHGAPFSEHSPLLHSLTQMPNWSKPHSGLKKMFLGEVVGKRVVVQGLWVGGWVWGEDVPGEDGRTVKEKKHEQGGKRAQGGSGDGVQASTGAPWAGVGRVDGRRGVLDSTRSAWASTTLPQR